MVNIETAIAELNKQHHIPTSIEFTVQEDFINNLPAIVSNLEQVEQWAIAQTEQDRNLVLVTDEDFESAKERSAQLNKQIKLIEDKRKEIKKAYNQPYEVFERASKRVTAVLSTARENLWSQVTKSEEQEKENKKQRLREYWEEKTRNHVVSNRTFEQIFDSKWLNKGTKIETAYSEMDKIFEETLSDIYAIRSLKSEFEVSLMDYYKNGHSVSEVISYNNRLQEAQKQAEIQKSWTSKVNTQTKEETANLPQNNEPSEETEEFIRMEFFVECTNEQLQELGNYLREKGIRYGRIKK